MVPCRRSLTRMGSPLRSRRFSQVRLRACRSLLLGRPINVPQIELGSGSLVVDLSNGGSFEVHDVGGGAEYGLWSWDSGNGELTLQVLSSKVVTERLDSFDKAFNDNFDLEAYEALGRPEVEVEYLTTAILTLQSNEQPEDHWIMSRISGVDVYVRGVYGTEVADVQPVGKWKHVYRRRIYGCWALRV